MKLYRCFIAATFVLVLTLIGTTLRAQVGHETDPQYAAPGVSGVAPFTCPLSTSTQAAHSLCVTVVIAPGSVGKGAAAFGANPLNVDLGTTVIWVNQDQVAHTVTANDGSFDSGSLSPGQSFAHTFNSPGNETYYCAIHGEQSMSGAVAVSSTPATPVGCPVCTVVPVSPTVRPSPSPSPTPSPSPSPSPTVSPSLSPSG